MFGVSPVKESAHAVQQCVDDDCVDIRGRTQAIRETTRGTGGMNDEQISVGRQYDRQVKDRYFKAPDPAPTPSPSTNEAPKGFWQNVRRSLGRK